MKSPTSKKILYNWKLLYYFYNRFPINLSFNNEEPKEGPKKKTADDPLTSKAEVFGLIDYIASNYSIADKTLVFHPNTNKTIIEKCQEAGFSIIILDSSNDRDWTFEYDSHWTCYGHEKVAEQVANAIKKKVNDNQPLQIK